MCGIVGIAGVMPVNQSIYDALTVLQHRGQDAAGIITIDANNCFRLRKANGLVNDIFEARHMQRFAGQHGDRPCALPYRRQLQRFRSATFLR
ncbi:amidophosphoribosyltransferase [Salmonella enterica subsp. enterica serovar Heidelberg]|nr:amidophosphoribosyltransferase [Salmonella enterica subsp. enterica serovar Heidelberg]